MVSTLDSHRRRNDAPGAGTCVRPGACVTAITKLVRSAGRSELVEKPPRGLLLPAPAALNQSRGPRSAVTTPVFEGDLTMHLVTIASSPDRAA